MTNNLSRAALIGLVAGFVGGLFGIGGGVVVVPGLVLVMAMAQHRASATSVAAIVASSAAALISFASDGEVDWPAAMLVFIGAGTGAFLGARFMARVPAEWLMRTFAVVIVVAAVRMAF